MNSAPQLPNYLGLPFRILVSPFVNFDPENRVTDIMMFNSRNLGALIVDEDPHVKSWEDGQYNIQNMSIEETYGFGILNEGQAIAVAKNVKIRPNEFVMPARKASKQHIPGLFFLWAGKRLARGRRPRPEPGSVIETNAHAPQPGERPLASQVEADAPFRPAFEVTGVSNDADNSGLVIAGLIDHGLGLLIKAWAGGYG